MLRQVHLNWIFISNPIYVYRYISQDPFASGVIHQTYIKSKPLIPINPMVYHISTKKITSCHMIILSNPLQVCSASSKGHGKSHILQPHHLRHHRTISYPCPFHCLVSLHNFSIIMSLSCNYKVKGDFISLLTKTKNDQKEKNNYNLII